MTDKNNQTLATASDVQNALDGQTKKPITTPKALTSHPAFGFSGNIAPEDMTGPNGINQWTSRDVRMAFGGMYPEEALDYEQKKANLYKTQTESQKNLADVYKKTQGDSGLETKTVGGVLLGRTNPNAPWEVYYKPKKVVGSQVVQEEYMHPHFFGTDASSATHAVPLNQNNVDIPEPAVTGLGVPPVYYNYDPDSTDNKTSVGGYISQDWEWKDYSYVRGDGVEMKNKRAFDKNTGQPIIGDNNSVVLMNPFYTPSTGDVQKNTQNIISFINKSSDDVKNLLSQRYDGGIEMVGGNWVYTGNRADEFNQDFINQVYRKISNTPKVLLNDMNPYLSMVSKNGDALAGGNGMLHDRYDNVQYVGKYLGDGSASYYMWLTDDFTVKLDGNTYNTTSLQNTPIEDVVKLLTTKGAVINGAMVGTDIAGNIQMWTVDVDNGDDTKSNRIPSDTYHKSIYNDKLYDVITKKNGTKSYRYKGNQTGVYPVNPQ